MNALATFDRSVALDLERDLDFVVPANRTAEPEFAGRPNVSAMIDAISGAAASLSAKDERIHTLEGRLTDLEDLAYRMKTKLDEMLQLHKSTSAFASSETERANRAESHVTALQSRVQNLEEDHEAALTDLHRIAEVITASGLLTKHIEAATTPLRRPPEFQQFRT